MKKLMASVALVFQLLIMGGCTPDRGGATTLGTTGGAVADTARTYMAETHDGIESFVEAKYVESALTGLPVGAGTLKAIDEAADHVALREQVAAKLSETYAAFRALAEYDASGQVEKGINDLTDSVNAYAKAVGSNTPPMSGVAAGSLSMGGGLIAGQVQDRMLKRGSADIRVRVERFRDAMGLERTAFIAIQDRRIKEHVGVATALWDVGFGDPAPILRRQTEGFGLTYDAQQASQLLAKLRSAAAGADQQTYKRVQAAVTNVMGRRAALQGAIENAAFDDLHASLGELIDQHTRFERGEPLTVANLTATLETISHDAERLKKLKDEDAKTTK